MYRRCLLFVGPSVFYLLKLCGSDEVDGILKDLMFDIRGYTAKDKVLIFIYLYGKA